MAGQSALTQALSSDEDWGAFAWNGADLIDPLFQGEGAPLPGWSEGLDLFDFDAFTLDNAAPDQAQSQPSMTASILEEASSPEFAVSFSPSLHEGSLSSFNHSFYQSSGSPAYAVSPTSPLIGQGDLLPQSSYGTYNEMLSPQSMGPPSPFFGSQSFTSTSSQPATLAPGILNPFLQGTPHTFSGLDVSASRAFAQLETPLQPTVDFVPEHHEENSSEQETVTLPIPIAQSVSGTFINTFSTDPTFRQTLRPRDQHHPRAITIPRPNSSSVGSRRPRTSSQLTVHNPMVASATSAMSPPPVPSLRTPENPHVRMSRQSSGHGHDSSPRTQSRSHAAQEQMRAARPATMSRSSSNSQHSRNGRPSSASNSLGWIPLHPDANNRLVPEVASGKRPRGRMGSLTAEQRSNAAIMRHMGSCSNCKKRKEKCDPGVPCKSCLEHYKTNLINHPCRDRHLIDLAAVFLAERKGWHPSVRSIGNHQVLTISTHMIPIVFGFGPPLSLPVHAIEFPDDNSVLLHKHVIYKWPPHDSTKETHKHAVLPALITPEAMDHLQETLESHLNTLVTSHFRFFPVFPSPLRILRDIYLYYTALPPTSSYSRLLLQSLKLLVLVHIGGDITLSPPSTDPALDHLLRTSFSLPEGAVPTPCLIRAQFGSVMPALALKLMREVLHSLELVFLHRSIHEWPVAVASLLVLLMTVESIQYHATKIPYHHHHPPQTQDTTPSVPSPASITTTTNPREADLTADDEPVRSLIAFYTACFSGCHARLRPDWQGDASTHKNASASTTTAREKTIGDTFVEKIREAVRQCPEGYLAGRAKMEMGAEMRGDMGAFFERLVARVLC